MEWFKMHSEARNDKKLATLPDAQRWVWFCLMCLASENKAARGTIPPMKPRLLAIEVAGGDESLLDETIPALIDLDILDTQDDGSLVFLHWAERQYDKPSDRPDAVRERVTRYRARKNEVKRDVTRSNATEQIQNQNQIQNREDSLTPPISPPTGGTRTAKAGAEIADNFS